MSENKVRGAILSRYPTVSEFARKLGWSRQKLSYFVSGEREPSLSDIQLMAKHLVMDSTELASFFLDLQSQKCDGDSDGYQ